MPSARCCRCRYRCCWTICDDRRLGALRRIRSAVELMAALVLGLLFHAIPGLTTSMAISICLPIIPYMDFLSALIFMTAMYTGSLFGVAIPAILLNVPGSASAVRTTFDG